MKQTTQTTEVIDFTRINSDVNGKPRFVCHFLKFINEGDRIKCDTKGLSFVSCEYEIALRKARKLGGRKFHNKQYGGGIVFQMYEGEKAEMTERINELKELNTDFLTEWTDKQFKQVEKAIYRHFCSYTYKFQPTHDKESRKDFRPFRYEEIETTLGLAYTSTSKYAALWVCNSGYLMANDTHYFNAFAINKNGQIVGIVQDENENEIFIEL